MKETKCEVVRRELEELMLDAECTADAVRHLRECADCQEFHQRQTKLRQIVGSLGTIEAPADFDFRLRARLANESNSAAFHLRAAYWSFARTGLAAATMFLLFAGGIVLVRHLVTRQSEIMVRTDDPIKESPKPAGTTKGNIVNDKEMPAVANEGGSHDFKGGRPSQAGFKPRRSMVAVDFSNTGAQVISDSRPLPEAAAIFPIEASVQSLRVSLDDGRGNARTILVPTISFGSQRVLSSGNQFAPKDVW